MGVRLIYIHLTNKLFYYNNSKYVLMSSIFSNYVIANSNESDRALWMEKVVEAINGDPKPIHPKSKLLTKQSTLRLLDQSVCSIYSYALRLLLLIAELTNS